MHERSWFRVNGRLRTRFTRKIVQSSHQRQRIRRQSEGFTAAKGVGQGGRQPRTGLVGDTKDAVKVLVGAPLIGHEGTGTGPAGGQDHATPKPLFPETVPESKPQTPRQDQRRQTAQLLGRARVEQTVDVGLSGDLRGHAHLTVERRVPAGALRSDCTPPPPLRRASGWNQWFQDRVKSRVSYPILMVPADPRRKGASNTHQSRRKPGNRPRSLLRERLIGADVVWPPPASAKIPDRSVGQVVPSVPGGS